MTLNRVAESESKRAQAEEALQVFTHFIWETVCVYVLHLQWMREEVSGLQSERDSLQSSLAAATEEKSTLSSELSAAQSDLVTLQTQTDSVQYTAEAAEKEAASLREELATERESHSATKQKLTTAVKVSVYHPHTPLTVLPTSTPHTLCCTDRRLRLTVS